MTDSPRIGARYRPVLWEPIEETGERLVVLLCVEPEEESADEVAPATHVVVSAERLRALLGSTRGSAARQVHLECARFMTERQVRGEPIEQLRPLFRGYSVGPVQHARAYSVDQLLDAMVRTVSAFGSAQEILSVSDTEQPETTRRTAEFLRQVRRAFAAGDEERQRRFNVRLQLQQNAPEVWVDYAAGKVVLQATSVPGSPQQVPPAAAELKAKIFDLEVVRSEFGSNSIEPTLLLNVRSLEEARDESTQRIARKAHSQIRSVADWARLKVIEVGSASAAVEVLERL